MCWRSDDMMISVDKWSWCQWHVMKWPETWRRHFRWKRTCWVGYGASVVQWHWLTWINPIQCDCDLCIVKCVDDLMTWSVLTSDHEMTWNLKATFPVKKNLLSWVRCLSSAVALAYLNKSNPMWLWLVHCEMCWWSDDMISVDKWSWNDLKLETFPVKKNLLSWVECKKHLSSRPINEFKPQENIIDIQRVHQSCECRCESVLWYIPDYILYTYIFNEWSSEAVLFFFRDSFQTPL